MQTAALGGSNPDYPPSSTELGRLECRTRSGDRILVEQLSALLAVLGIGWFWLNAARAREMAVGLAQRACKERGVQLLDQAVALRRLGLRWRAQGLRIRRVYRFDFSEEGVGRRTGYLVLLGLQLVDLSLGLPELSDDA